MDSHDFTEVYPNFDTKVVKAFSNFLKLFNCSTTCGWKNKKVIEGMGHTKVHLALMYLSIQTVEKV